LLITEADSGKIINRKNKILIAGYSFVVFDPCDDAIRKKI